MPCRPCTGSAAAVSPVADTLPVDTTSPAIAALTPPIARLDVPAAEVEAEARRIWAERDLRVHALNAGMTADEYRRAGLLAEQHHQLDDPAVPYSPYLQLGGQS